MYYFVHFTLRPYICCIYFNFHVKKFHQFPRDIKFCNNEINRELPYIYIYKSKLKSSTASLGRNILRPPPPPPPLHTHTHTYLFPPLQVLQLLDPSEAQTELGLVPHDLKYSSTLSLDTRTRPPMEFMDALFQAVQKLLPDHRVVRAMDQDYYLSIDGSSVTVEVTTFEPLQEILITWGVKVCL